MTVSLTLGSTYLTAASVAVRFFLGMNMLTLDQLFHMIIDVLLEGIEEKYGKGAIDRPVAIPVHGSIKVDLCDADGMRLELGAELGIAGDPSQMPGGPGGPGGFPG